MARVLVIDDSAVVVRFVKQALLPAGHTVEALDSFVGLIGVLSERPPDLILLDLNMPVMPGTSVGRIVQDHRANHVPIVIYSSECEEKLRTAARQLSARAYLSKTNDPEKLRRTVNGILGRNRSVAR